MNKTSLIALAMLATVGLALIPNLAGADPAVEQTWVRMRGLVTHYGATPVFGGLWAHARMVDVNDSYREWAGSHAIWSDAPKHINCTEPPTENFTYILYAAKLVNSSMIELNYLEYNFYISGVWNVDKVTFAYYVDENGELVSYSWTIEPVVTGAEGELRVLQSWTRFELAITGVDLISGIVVHYAIGHMEIKIGDINSDNMVNIKDLVGVAKKYGAMPALGNYEFEMDFNADYKIDIGDLTTLAANIQAP
jgi:hypothetical protein